MAGKRYVCICCGAAMTRIAAAVSILCDPCAAAGCEPAYRPWCAVSAETQAERGEMVAMTFMCGAGLCLGFYDYAPGVGPPDLRVVK